VRCKPLKRPPGIATSVVPEELHTAQSAISRHISTLESRLNTSLFNRHKKRRLLLTHQGEQLYRAVISGFDNIQTTIDAISGTSLDEHLTIACTHEVSHLYLLPRFAELQQDLGSDKPIRVMTYEYDVMETALDPRIDIVIQHDVSGVDAGDRLCIVREAVRPVVSPGFYEQHETLLQQEILAWEPLIFLELSKQNYGWATWDDWFRLSGNPDFAANYVYFNNYVYLLEAAAGKGLALGWRGLIERHLANAALLPLREDYIEFHRGLHAVLTEYGRNKALARQCLAYLAEVS
jgi:LysR family glycine cleavage system transcriptional activator